MLETKASAHMQNTLHLEVVKYPRVSIGPEKGAYILVNVGGFYVGFTVTLSAIDLHVLRLHKIRYCQVQSP